MKNEIIERDIKSGLLKPLCSIVPFPWQKSDLLVMLISGAANPVLHCVQRRVGGGSGAT